MNNHLHFQTWIKAFIFTRYRIGNCGVCCDSRCFSCWFRDHSCNDRFRDSKQLCLFIAHHGRILSRGKRTACNGISVNLRRLTLVFNSDRYSGVRLLKIGKHVNDNSALVWMITLCHRYTDPVHPSEDVRPEHSGSSA